MKRRAYHRYFHSFSRSGVLKLSVRSKSSRMNSIMPPEKIRRPDFLAAVPLGIVDRNMRRPLPPIERELVQADRQRSAGRSGLATNCLGHLMNRPVIQLNRCHAEARIAESESQFLDGIARAVHRDRMIVGIDGADVIGKLTNPLGAEIELAGCIPRTDSIRAPGDGRIGRSSRDSTASAPAPIRRRPARACWPLRPR